MIPIFVNGRFLSQRLTGVQRFAIELLSALDRTLGEKQGEPAWRILAPVNMETTLSLKNIPTEVVGRLKGYAWDQIDLPYHARSGVLVSLANTGPILHRRHLLVTHDTAPFANPANFSFTFRLVYRVMQPLLGRTTKRLMTVSNFSRGEMVKYLGVPESKIDVVYNGGDHILRAESDASVLNEYGLEPRKYIFAVGSVSPNKNFRAVVEAYQRLQRSEVKLAVAGGQNARVFSGADLSNSPGIVRLGYVTDSALRALYENALCFVFPSVYEGFGIPPIEAMCCGCPAVVSTAPAVREACGDAALYAEPHDYDTLASQITRLVDDDALWHAMQEKGFARANEFTWERSAQRLYDIVNTAAGRAA